MILSLDRSASDEALAADVCIVGGGPAGIVLALELGDAGIDVLLAESGGEGHRPAAQALGEAEIAEPRWHAPLAQAASRRLGGTSAWWGGRCVPLDPVDFEARAHVPESGWPLSHDEIARHYPKACAWAGCGAADFDARSALPGAPPGIVPGLPDGAITSTSLERWGAPTNFAHAYRKALRDHPRVTVVLDATCVDIEFAAAREHASAIVLRSLAGRSARATARAFVIACGGLGSTRLLMIADRLHPGGVGNHGGHLGRWYMGHLSGKIADIEFATDPARTAYGFERDAAGVFCRKRFALAAHAQRRHELLNCAFWLDNPPMADARHGNGILSAAYLALSTPIVRDYLAPQAIVANAVAGAARPALAAHLANVLADLPAVAGFLPAFSYRRYFARRRIPGLFLHNRNNRYALHFHAEQAPDAVSRVILGNGVDALGMRRLVVDLKFGAGDAASVVRSHHLLDRHLRRHGCGRLAFKPGDPVESVLAQSRDGFHQIGTTRMSADPGAGVVDRDCRVHGVANLYVCSSSVFPTSGQANPTLTVLALAVRLSAHLRKSLACTT